MNKHVSFDAENEVIIIDLAELTITDELMKTVIEEVQEVTQTLNKKYWALLHWKNTKIPDPKAPDFNKFIATLLEYVLGIERYETEGEGGGYKVINRTFGTYLFSKKPKSKTAALAHIRILEQQ